MTIDSLKELIQFDINNHAKCDQFIRIGNSLISPLFYSLVIKNPLNSIKTNDSLIKFNENSFETSYAHKLLLLNWADERGRITKLNFSGYVGDIMVRSSWLNSWCRVKDMVYYY